MTIPYPASAGGQSLRSKLFEKSCECTAQVIPRRHLTKLYLRPPESQVASRLKSAEEEATLLTIDLSAPFLPLEKYIFGKYCCQFLISRIWEH